MSKQKTQASPETQATQERGKTYEIVLANNTYSLSNELLNKELNVIIDSIKTMDTATWQYATSIYNIVNGELFREDFGDIKTFASAIETSTSNIYKIVQAVDFGLKNGLIGLMAYSKVYLLSTINKFERFQKWSSKKDIDYTKLSKHQLEDTIREYNNKYSKKNVVDNEEKEEEKHQRIKYKGCIYDFPISILNKYFVGTYEEKPKAKAKKKKH